MENMSSVEGVAGSNDNYIMGEFEFINSKVSFKGKNNILLTPCVPNSKNKVKLKNSNINFEGDNSLCFLNTSYTDHSINLDIFNNSVFYMGENIYINTAFNQSLFVQCSEQCNIFIGNECLFSFGVWMRTSDVHLIYDANTNKRMNHSKSIYIGDHIWIGQNTAILKGTHIGSGSITGANSVLAGKIIPSNTLWGGNPAKLIKRDVFFVETASHNYKSADTEYWNEYPTNLPPPRDKYIYRYDENDTLDFHELERIIKSLPTATEKARLLMKLNQLGKNRFYVG